MIIKAKFENILSFNNETEICFIAGKGTSLPTHVHRAEKRDDISILKSSIIYGANASGKSNLIRCMNLLKNIALGVFPKNNWDIFKLSPEKKVDSKLEIEIKANASYYSYGIIFNIKGIKREWLYQINSRSKKKIFERKQEMDSTSYFFGEIEGNEESRQFIKFLSDGTPIDKSFLSEYHKRNGKGIVAITNVYNWFDDNLKIIFPETRFRGLSFRLEKDDEFSTITKGLLHYFNTGISDLKRVATNKEETDLPKNIISKILSEAKPDENCCVASSDQQSVYFFETDNEGTTKIYKQMTVHKNSQDEDVIFDMDEESDGSIRLLDFIPMLIDLQFNSAVYLIDEIDRSMHPLMSQKILDYYFTQLPKDNYTQLICTTHESHLLDANFIRADEVWFVEKDKDGSTKLTSLADYKPRVDIRKSYLQGKYGAIPFFANINTLNWRKIKNKI
ncbi:AAA family ATPase [Macellibacteroides fermentans]|uniref:ATPase AAA-type core domain-containing protein n=1 Tax=Parabacteroides chartae TaxID=1037355 RepID=A0A1T5F0R9_9BACT|nr:ATP-binding protein [Parabacteroides chartae]SKB89716.1 hypothetical protein SAMN05660349_03248 [Parabacteroides chartae]